MSSYLIHDAELETDIYYLNLPARAYNAVMRNEIKTIRQLLQCTETELLSIRNLGQQSLDDILTMQARIKDVLSNNADLNDPDNFLIFCVLNRAKVIKYYSEYSDLPVSSLPFSTNLKNRLYLAGYKRLSQIVLNIPEEDDRPMWSSLQKISIVSRYYLRDEKDGILAYLNGEHENTNDFPDQSVLKSVTDKTADRVTQDNEEKRSISSSTRIIELPLSIRSKNALIRNGILTVGDLIKTNRPMLEKMRGLGLGSVEEIMSFIEKNKAIEDASIDEEEEKIILQRKKDFEEFVRIHDFQISDSYLFNKTKNAIAELEISTFSELRKLDLYSIPEESKIGRTTLRNIAAFIDETEQAFMKEFNEYYVDGHYTATYIQNLVLRIFSDSPFKGYSYRRIKEKLPEYLTDEEIKNAIGKLIAAKELEYTDFRCYKVYPSFFSVLSTYIEETENNKQAKMLAERFEGETLQKIGDKWTISRERVRQLTTRELGRIKESYRFKTGYNVFDEDYYQYLWENYLLAKDVCINDLGIPGKTYLYLRECYPKGKIRLEDAVTDDNVDTAIKLKIISHINKDKVEIDGQLFEKKKSEIEDYIISEYCREDTHIEDYFRIYQEVLQKNGIEYDDSIYLDKESDRYRFARLAEKDCVLWKEGKTFRYYNIRANDYTELLDTLNLQKYKNTEVSTLKFIEDYPDLMKTYDIRDPYELHNLLRKILDPSAYNDLDFHRTPVLRFGEFDRYTAIYDLICTFSPVKANDLINIIHDIYGYSKTFIQMQMLSPFSEYIHKGVYSVDFQRIPEDRTESFKRSLTGDFYYIEELRKKYTEMFEGADQNDINPYTIKDLGFKVYSTYAVQHYKNAYDYFAHELKKSDVYDISGIYEKYSNLTMFRDVLHELKEALDIFEFEPNQFITINRLQKLNISKKDLRNYIDEVYEAASDYSFFTISVLRNEGYTFPLDDLGLNECFNWNLLAQDKRFQVRRIADSAIIGTNCEYTDISEKQFILWVLDDYDSIDPADLLERIRDEYGLKFDRQRVLNAVRDTNKYYDPIMDKVYRNKMLYYDEFED